MIETSIATNTTTVASALVSVTNESITKKPSIFESVCVKVEVLEEIQPTVSLEARFQIFHTMTAEALFTVMCDLIRSFSIFPGNLLILNSKSTKTNSVGHHDISFHTESGLFMMKFGSKFHENGTIENIQDKLWSIFKTLESENQISKITKPNTWLETIEDRVLILNFIKPAFGEWQRNDARTLSFFGILSFKNNTKDRSGENF